MKVRLWLVEHRLTAAEEQRVRENRKNRNADLGQVKISYRKKRRVLNSDGWNSVDEAVAYATVSNREAMEDIPDVLTKFTTVFAAAPAEDGEKCSQIENAWSAEERELPLE